MAWGWVVPMAAGLGLVAWRSWRQDAAIRSGELMDLRDALPGGEADVEIRMLANRRYRIELQVEASVEASRAERDEAGAARAVSPDDHDATSEAGLWPFELVVARADGTERGGGEGVVHHATGALEPLLGFAARMRRTVASPDGPIVTTTWAGHAPLLELTTDSLVRLRFEVAVVTEQTVVADGVRRRARLEKARLVVKEDVRPLRGRAARFDRIALPAFDRV